MKMLSSRIRTMMLLRCDVAAVASPVPDAPHGVAIHRLDPQHAGRLPEVNPAVDPAIEAAKFEAGMKCYVACLDARIAHYCWVQDSGIHVLAGTGVSRRIRPGHIWLHAGFTAPWARGRSIYPAVLRRILHDYRELGATTAWGYVLASNTASLHGTARAGLLPVARLHSLVIRNSAIPLFPWRAPV